MAKNQTRYYTQTMPGVEEIAWLEIRSRLTQVKFGEFMFSKEQNGIVAFDYGGDMSALLQLRCNEDIFIQALSLSKVSRDWRDLRLVREKVHKSVEFGRAIDEWLKEQRLKRPPTYRVISRKYGKHQYRRKDLEDAVNLGMKSRFPRWRQVPDRAQLEIWTNLLGSRLLIGLRLSDRTMRHRFRKVEELEASLRPSVAAAMIHLTDPEPDDLFVDPMCGSGTLLLERQLAGAYGRILGGDIVPDRASATRNNLAAQRKDFGQKPIAACCWDGRYLPLASGIVDKVATNLPFGKQLGSPAEMKRLYPTFFSELERILRPDGRAIILSSEFDLVKESVRRCKGLEILSGYSIALLGQWGRIYIMQRRS